MVSIMKDFVVESVQDVVQTLRGMNFRQLMMQGLNLGAARFCNFLLVYKLNKIETSFQSPQKYAS